MANFTIIGGAARVTQTSTVIVGSATNGHTFILSARHPSGSSSAYVDILTVTADGVLTTAQIASAIVAAWNASNHSFARAVTASIGATTSTVLLTADRSGVPFLVKTSGTGTTTPTTGNVLTDLTANEGPNCLTAANIAEGVMPTGNTNEVQLTGEYDLLYNLDQSAYDILSFTRYNHTGRVGWPGMPLKVSPKATTGRFINNTPGGGVAYIHVGTNDVNVDVIDAGQSYPIALHLSGGNSSAEWTFHSGNVGVAWIQGDVATAGTVINQGANISIGPLAVVTNYRQTLGWAWDLQVANRTLVYLDGGEYKEELAGTLATLTNNGVYATMLGLGDIQAGTLAGGYSDFVSAQQARSVTVSYVYDAAAFSTRITGTQTPLGKAGKGVPSFGGGA